MANAGTTYKIFTHYSILLKVEIVRFQHLKMMIFLVVKLFQLIPGGIPQCLGH